MMAERFDITSFVVVRTRDEVAEAVHGNPFAADGAENLVHTQFLGGQPSAAQFGDLLAAYAGRGTEGSPLGTARSISITSTASATRGSTGPFIERRLGCRGTARNLRSLQRILDRMDEHDLQQPATPAARSVRLLKVGEQVRHVISELLMRQEVHDDVLSSHTVSVTEVRMSPSQSGW